jgi:hypothetical protein
MVFEGKKQGFGTQKHIDSTAKLTTCGNNSLPQ